MMGADAFERPHDLAKNHALGRPDIGVGPNCVIRNAIIDKNARIGAGCRLSPIGLPEKWESESLFVRDGVIVVKATGESGRFYVVETSADMSKWSEVGIARAVNGITGRMAPSPSPNNREGPKAVRAICRSEKAAGVIGAL